MKAGMLHVHGVPVAETEFARDALNLAETARTILGDRRMRIAAGPAALAEMLAREIELPRDQRPWLPVIRTCLVINGSRHERSVTQMRQAEAQGWRVLRPKHRPNSDAAAVARENGRYAVEQTAVEEPDAVFVIGGDTAFAVIRALGLPPLLPIAEVVLGVPVTRIEAARLPVALPRRKRDLYLITKAGGFGESDLFAQVRAKLSHAG